jgi:hypothetical protein
MATLDETCTHVDITQSFTLSMFTNAPPLYSEKQFTIHLVNVDDKICGNKIILACD